MGKVNFVGVEQTFQNINMTYRFVKILSGRTLTPYFFFSVTRAVVSAITE